MMLIENTMSDLVTYFMLPVLVALMLMFCYSVIVLGGFLYELVLRTVSMRQVSVLTRAVSVNIGVSVEELELLVLKELEGLRIVSRVAPMLGLVATMIPMGPALMAVSAGDSIGMAEQLVVAFSAVIVALMSAAITYVVMLVRRRWLLAELNSFMSGTPLHESLVATPREARA